MGLCFCCLNLPSAGVTVLHWQAWYEVLTSQNVPLLCMSPSFLLRSISGHFLHMLCLQRTGPFSLKKELDSSLVYWSTSIYNRINWKSVFTCIFQSLEHPGGTVSMTAFQINGMKMGKNIKFRCALYIRLSVASH